MSLLLAGGAWSFYITAVVFWSMTRCRLMMSLSAADVPESLLTHNSSLSVTVNVDQPNWLRNCLPSFNLPLHAHTQTHLHWSTVSWSITIVSWMCWCVHMMVEISGCDQRIKCWLLQQSDVSWHHKPTSHDFGQVCCDVMFSYPAVWVMSLIQTGLWFRTDRKSVV